jgi:hypothetical protein
MASNLPRYSRKCFEIISFRDLNVTTENGFRGFSEIAEVDSAVSM